MEDDYTIIDCYTDEPSGLGVPPYLGTFPRYIYGALKKKGMEAKYLTIDDIRLWKKYNFRRPDKSKEMKTNIKIYNLTKNADRVREILENTTHLIVVAGINVPGKYLSAEPGSLGEITSYIKELKCKKTLTGTAALVGSQAEGGKMPERFDEKVYDKIEFNYMDINDYPLIEAKLGASIVEQIPWEIIAEIETGRGCDIGKCSFCTEPIKSRVQFRPSDDVIEEMKELSRLGVNNFRFGKQTCFFSYQNGDVREIEKILKAAYELKPMTLHIDNVNPNKVVGKNGREIAELVVKYCTPGNVAAFGIESFDPEVVKKNTLNTSYLVAYKAVKILNEIGAERGLNGMPKFLPGVNLIFGLNGETKESNSHNFIALKRLLDEGLLLRRINIRQVVPFEGTKLYEECGTKLIKKNKKHYWKWRDQIRQDIDFPMLKRLVPEGTMLKNVRMEIYDGKTTFGRQFGTYPLIVGVKKRLELGEYYTVRVKGHMLRSITAEVLEKE